VSRKADHWAPLFEGITTSTRLADRPDHAARLFYVMLQTKLDDWGRFSADPRKLNALVWPMLKMTDKATLAAVKACRKVGLIEIYEVDGEAFLVNVEHEEKAGRIGKRDHRRLSEFPDVSSLAPAGPDWPGTGPIWPSRVGARARPRAAGLGWAGLGSAGGSAEGEPAPAALPAVEAKPQPKPRAVPTTTHHRFIAWWAEEYRAATKSQEAPDGREYPFQSGKDGAHVRALCGLAKDNLAEMQECARRLMTDPFWAAKGFDLGVLRSQYARLLASDPRKAKANGHAPRQTTYDENMATLDSVCPKGAASA
jgi:hypothetical protein